MSYVLAGLVLLGLLAQPLRAPAQPAVPEGMVRVEGGTYTPLYRGAFNDGIQYVAAFYLDAHPVNNADFLVFVTAHPEWRRSQVKTLFAEADYLAHWAGDLDLGDASLADRPVVNVSWFAVNAYADWLGKRLPTLAEWEYAAAASRMHPDGHAEDGFAQRILQEYTRRPAAVQRPVGTGKPNYWGMYDMHSLVWEWVYDFNSALVTGESRNNTDLDAGLFCGSASLGASDFMDYAAFLRFALRSGLKARYAMRNMGFRLAASIPTYPSRQP